MRTFSPQTVAALLITAAMCGSANAADTYTLRENLKVNQQVPYIVTTDYKVNSTSTANGISTPTNTDAVHSWKLTLTILAVKDGSSIRSQADVDAVSTDTSKTGSADSQKTSCPFGGKSIVLTRHPDDSLANDFAGNASDDDNNLLNNFVTPDEEWYPDQPVAVGDTWDDSVKAGKFAFLGPQDRLTSKGRLDWVRTINGRQIAHLTQSMAIIYHEDGNVEEDMQLSLTQLVDMSTGIIILCDQTGTSTYSTPPNQTTQVSGGTTYTFHAEVPPVPPEATASQP